LYLVTVTFLCLLLDVMGVWVLHSVLELVFWMSLQNSISEVVKFHFHFSIRLW
jgi:hypothetical protein